ncbi:MAG: methionine synthase [Ruminococcaceae bacterium]|nr:methionine synthase [Oscillospiraceae bacterium]
MQTLRVDRALALRYLGCARTDDVQILSALEQAAELVEEIAQPRCVTFSSTITLDAEGVHFDGTTLCLPGKDISNLLSHAEIGILFCATLGNEVDRLIARWQLKDLSFAAMLDACASSAVEVLCDGLEAELIEEHQTRGLFLTDRFSPGYGDLPLCVQSELCAVLDTPRRIGVQVSSSSILNPRKSVTAVLGVCASAQPKRDRCSGCLQHDTCLLRKEGAYCADP